MPVNPVKNDSNSQVPLTRRNSVGPRDISPKTPNASMPSPLTMSDRGPVDGIDRDAKESRTTRLEGTAKTGAAMHDDFKAIKLDKKMNRVFLAKKIAPLVMAGAGLVSLILLFAAPHLMIVPGLLFFLSVGAETVAASYIRRKTKEEHGLFIKDFEASKVGLKAEQAALIEKKLQGPLSTDDETSLAQVSEVLEHGDFLTNDLSLPFTFPAMLQAKSLVMGLFQKARAAQGETPKTDA